MPVHALSSIPLIVFGRKLCAEGYTFNSNSHHSKEDIQLYLKDFPLHITEKSEMVENMEEKKKNCAMEKSLFQAFIKLQNT